MGKRTLSVGGSAYGCVVPVLGASEAANGSGSQVAWIVLGLAAAVVVVRWLASRPKGEDPSDRKPITAANSVAPPSALGAEKEPHQAFDEGPLAGMIPDEPGVIPPVGWVRAQVEGKGVFWVNPKRLELNTPDVSRLTREQKQRICAFKEKLGPLDPVSLAKTLENFSRDQDPDSEIAVWEQIAAVVVSELAERRGASDGERRLVYDACLSLSFANDVGKALSRSPRLKALAGLDRIAQKMREGPPSAD